MTNHETESYRKRLMDERARLLQHHQRQNDLQNQDVQEETGELTDFDPNNPGDSGRETFERGKDMALNENAEDILQKIDTAISRLDKGSYGICERCNKPIPHERLKALPYATQCIDCQTRMETL